MTAFATDAEGLCAQCKMKGRLQLCPVFKVECSHAKDIPLSSKVESKKAHEGIVEKDKELE